MKNIIDQYNKVDTIAVLSSFAHTEDVNQSAIDRYNSRKLTDLAKSHPVIICGEKKGLEPYGASKQLKKNILIARVWEKGNIFSYVNLLRFVSSLNKVKTILVEFEFNVFGGTLMNIALLFTLLILRLQGKRIVFELHQVIINVSKLEKHLNIHNKYLELFYNFGIKLYFIAIGLISHTVVVLEEELKYRLKGLVNQNKIIHLPHHMRIHNKGNKSEAKRKLGIKPNSFVVLVFGYLNWYKGVDWIIKTAQLFKGTHVHFLIAGGPNPYHLHKKYYNSYYRSLIKRMFNNPQITYSGFVEEKDMDTIFSAADLMALPYRVFMAASGPFSQALSYKVPVILSDRLKDYAKSHDFAQAMKDTSLQTSELFFPLKQQKFKQMVVSLSNSTTYQQKVSSFVGVLGKLRSSQSLKYKFTEVLFPLTDINTFLYNIYQFFHKINYT